MVSHGRSAIYTDAEIITRDNVVSILSDAMSSHAHNRSDIQYLYDYYRGIQPILNRKKTVRPEINNKIVVNRANEIVSFKSSYLIGEPVQYVQRGSDDYSEAINTLNEYVFSEDKASKDKELADWFHICGVAYRMVLPDKQSDEKDEAPFEIYTLDPRNTFVVKYSGLGNKVKMGVTYVTKSDGDVIYSVYTEDKYFEINSFNKIIKDEVNPLGAIPIIEYKANEAMLGAFEVVIDLLDAINNTVSNRIDGIEQFIQALLMFKGVDVDDKTFEKIKELGGIKVPSDGDVKYLIQELDQTQTQIAIDDMYQTVRNIVGIPSTANGQTSDSSNNGAVIMRNGWFAAESRAKDTETMFKRSEKEFLKVLIKITNTLRDMDLKLSAIDIRFTRRNYENIYQKAQVLALMLGLDDVHPKLAFEYCGMFVDPDVAYEMSKAYAKEAEKKSMAELEQFTQLQINESKKNELLAEEDVA